jgi:hypothetical protein
MQNVEDGWKLLLPVVAAICAGAQEDFDAQAAVEEAADLMQACQDYLEVKENDFPSPDEWAIPDGGKRKK